ncbi:hypothetical protein L195_g018166, partial [Trifolium pratense]
EGPQVSAAGWQTAVSQIGPNFVCLLIQISVVGSSGRLQLQIDLEYPHNSFAFSIYDTVEHKVGSMAVCGFFLWSPIFVEHITSKRLLKKIVVDAQSLIETKRTDLDAIRVDISKLFFTPQEDDAHILVKTYIDQKNLSLVLASIIIFCELVARRLRLIESQWESEFTGARYSELPNLEKLLSQFSRKYGEEFIANVTNGKANCGVNEKIIELLLVPNPPVEERNKLLKEIANQFHIDWDPETGKTCELQLMKYHSM